MIREPRYGVMSMNKRLLIAVCAATVLGHSTSPVLAALPEPNDALAMETAGASILMGVAAAVSTQSTGQRADSRAALSKRLGWLMDHNMRWPNSMLNDDRSRIVRVLFDVDNSGRAVNVRVGKRSGNRSIDRAASRTIARFDRLPGGERRRVCALVQIGMAGQDPTQAAFVRALKDEKASAIADLSRGIEGPTYDRRGRII